MLCHNTKPRYPITDLLGQPEILLQLRGVSPAHSVAHFRMDGVDHHLHPADYQHRIRHLKPCLWSAVPWAPGSEREPIPNS